HEGIFGIAGNSHTYQGRFSVFSPSENVSLTISRYDVSWADAAANLWIAGFYAGQEPDMSGIWADPIERAEVESADHFRRTGVTVRPAEEGAGS
ncbi:hypothetical protein PJI23_30855, partial [Mycobacterium kansasii]